jgi:hypothetical protein
LLAAGSTSATSFQFSFGSLLDRAKKIALADFHAGIVSRYTRQQLFCLDLTNVGFCAEPLGRHRDREWLKLASKRHSQPAASGSFRKGF